MGRPKGSKNAKRVEVDSPVAPNVTLAPSPPPIPTTFQVGSWYAYAGDDFKLYLDGHVRRWSIGNRFRVVKIFGDMLAIQFEDQSFEAIIDPDFAKFKETKAPLFS